jgi:hypothetical protein
MMCHVCVRVSSLRSLLKHLLAVSQLGMLPHPACLSLIKMVTSSLVIVRQFHLIIYDFD